CGGWTLGDLLDHMGDGLDAFTEASSGVIDVDVVPPVGTPVHVLREKACALLGAWSAPAPGAARLADARMESTLLLHSGALEITVHGWDVAQATGMGTPIPRALAADLMPGARALVAPADRGVRFADPVETSCGEPDDVLLLGFLGRSLDWASTHGAGGTNPVT
ncbi:MAG: hypothetical protein L0H93_19940, partial [Nocardioides sp.]|nr:hypothetical protein [Nocardioides sp.]